MSELSTQLLLALGDHPVQAPVGEAAAVPAIEPAAGVAVNDPKVLPLRRKARLFPAHLPRETFLHAPPSCVYPRAHAREFFSAALRFFSSTPFGRPPLRPRARAADNPACVRSRMMSRSNSANEAKM